MKTVSSLFLLFICNISWACEIDRPILSLSGPVTMLLEELDLLKDKNLMAISKFHPVKGEFKGEVLAGGLFLSKKTLKKHQGKVILYDKSRELKNFFKRAFEGKTFDVDTRGVDPFKANKIALEIITPYLKNCNHKINQLSLKLTEIQKSVNVQGKWKKSIFFLGKIKTKLPELVLSHDGFVLTLKKSNGFSSYPSELNYTTWSKKILNKLNGYLYIGLEGNPSDKLLVKKVSDSRYNLSMRGVLIPGIRQIYFLKEFSKLGSH